MILGNPSPSVIWWSSHNLIDDSYNELHGVVHNDLAVPNLNRNYLFKTFTCVASNSKLTDPLAVATSIDINCKYSSMAQKAL